MKELNIDRLEKICKTELNIFQKQALCGWAKEFEDTVRSEVKLECEHEYGRCLKLSVDYFLVSIAFVLHFGETTRFGTKRLGSVLRDIQETVELFRKNEYSAKDYLKMLKDDGVDLKIEL